MFLSRDSDLIETLVAALCIKGSRLKGAERHNTATRMFPLSLHVVVALPASCMLAPDGFRGLSQVIACLVLAKDRVI